MSDPTRERILTAFDRELEASPLPPGLRERTIRAAVTSSRQPARALQPAGLLTLVAVLVAVALVATLILVHLRPAPVPAHSTVPPSPRSMAAVAYDQARDVMVLFGGVGGSGNTAATLNETWTFDGKYWTHQHPAASPPATSDGVMAYDVRHRDLLLVMPTGVNGTTASWTWNGSTWQALHPAHSPQLGYGWQAPTMQFDPVTGTLLLFGFATDNHAAMWSWNGSDWAQLHPADLPGPGSAIAYDGHRVLMLASTAGDVSGRYFTQTWAWDGSNWNRLNPKVDLPEVGAVSTAYDPVRGRLVVFNGETWTWDGSTWARQHAALQPPRVGYLVYMSSLHEVISWGSAFDATDGEMYAWDGTSWTVIQPGPRPEVTPGWMTPEQADTLVRTTVKNSSPVLVPASLPSGPWDARVDLAGNDSFTITYATDQRDKSITLDIEGANPPPGNATSTDTYVKFRNSLPLKYHAAGYADYFVRYPASATSERWLYWMEPGTWAVGETKSGGVPYFLEAQGLTDQEFWQVANSLR